MIAAAVSQSHIDPESSPEQLEQRHG